MPIVADVELDIFSGMPNPTWPLAEADAQRLLKQVATLPRAPASDLPGQLGYRGFIVRVAAGADTQVIRVAAGTVHISKEGTTAHAQDAGRVLERWLLESGRPHLDSELFRMAEREVR